MKIYATGDLPSYFKINGEYAGVIDKNLSVFEVFSSDALFEALPVNSNYAPCYSNVEGSSTLKVFKVENGFLVYPVFKRKPLPNFKFVGQTEVFYEGIKTVLTVTEDGFTRFYLDGLIKDVKPLPFTPNNFELHIEKGLLFASFSLEKTALFIYDLQTAKLIFSSVLDGFSITENLLVKKKFTTALKTTVIERWELCDIPKLLSRESESEKSFFELPKGVIPTAFFESVVIGASVIEVAPTLSKRYDELRDFLGKVIRVIPSPNNQLECWLVLDSCVQKASVTVENGLITNVFLDDF